jgi:hypothetical protein
MFSFSNTPKFTSKRELDQEYFANSSPSHINYPNYRPKFYDLSQTPPNHNQAQPQYLGEHSKMAEFMNGEGGEYQRQKDFEDHRIPTDPNQQHH